MILGLKSFVSRYFGGDIASFAEYAGLHYQTAAKRIRDPRQQVMIEDGQFRLFVLDRMLPIRAYDIHYDHFNPYFLRFAFDSVFYTVLQSGQDEDENPILSLSSIGSESSPDVTMRVESHPRCSYTSLSFFSKEGKPIFELLFNDLGSHFILHKPYSYVFHAEEQNDDVLLGINSQGFKEAVHLCIEKGMNLMIRDTVLFGSM